MRPVLLLLLTISLLVPCFPSALATTQSSALQQIEEAEARTRERTDLLQSIKDAQILALGEFVMASVALDSKLTVYMKAMSTGYLDHAPNAQDVADCLDALSALGHALVEVDSWSAQTNLTLLFDGGAGTDWMMEKIQERHDATLAVFDADLETLRTCIMDALTFSKTDLDMEGCLDMSKELREYMLTCFSPVGF